MCASGTSPSICYSGQPLGDSSGGQTAQHSTIVNRPKKFFFYYKTYLSLSKHCECILNKDSYNALLLFICYQVYSLNVYSYKVHKRVLEGMMCV